MEFDTFPSAASNGGVPSLPPLHSQRNSRESSDDNSNNHALADRARSQESALVSPATSSSTHSPPPSTSLSHDSSSASNHQHLRIRSPSTSDNPLVVDGPSLLGLHRQPTLLQHENAFRSFCPIAVEYFLCHHRDYSLLATPHASSIQGAMLFVDMSGFTPLAERLSAQGMIGIEALSAHLNDYFGSMVDIIHRYEGDVTKFAGDALMIVFAADSFVPSTPHQQQQQTIGSTQHQRSSSHDPISHRRSNRAEEESEYVGDEDEEVTDDVKQPSLKRTPSSESASFSFPPPPPPMVSSSSSSSASSTKSSHCPESLMRDLTLRACSCALAIHNEFDGFVPAQGVTLRLHSAISAGQLYGVHVGGNERWEWLLKGRPLTELGKAMKSSEKGQIVLHPSAMSYVEGCITAKPIRPPSSPKYAPVQHQTPQRKLSRASLATINSPPPIPSPPLPTSGEGCAPIVCHLLISDSPPVAAPNTKRPHLTILVPPASPNDHVAASRASPPTSHNMPVPAESMMSHSPNSASSSPGSTSSQYLHPTRASSYLSPHLNPSRPFMSPSVSSSSGERSFLTLHDLFRRRSQLVAQSLSPAMDNNDTYAAAMRTAHNRVVISEEEDIKCEIALRAYVPTTVLGRVAAGHRAWLAEFRRVTTLFILLPEHDFDSEDSAVRQSSLMAFQAIVAALMEVCFKHKGDVRQLITDDKGTVMILLFGLQADWANPLRGVRAALEIQERVAAMNAKVAIGMTTGKVFCGTVGNHLRCEYTAVGDKVNTAARLMVAVPECSGIYCDHDTVQATGNAVGIAFKALPPIMVKGKAAPVAIYTPYRRSQSSRSQQSLQHIDPKWATKMSGRHAVREKVDAFLTLTKPKEQNGAPFSPPADDRCNILYIEAVARGVGKSVLLSAAYAKCVQQKLIVLIGVANDSESTPYHVFESMIPKMLKLLRDVQVGECSLKRDENEDETGLVRVSKGGREKGVNDEDDDEEEGEDVSQHEWLHDPDVLAIDDDLKTNGQLCLLNDLCSVVNFQHTEGITINLVVPSSSVSSSSPTGDQVPPMPALTGRSSSLIYPGAFTRSVSHTATPRNGELVLLTNSERYNPLGTSSNSQSASRDRSIPLSPATGGSEGQAESSSVSPHYALTTSGPASFLSTTSSLAIPAHTPAHRSGAVAAPVNGGFGPTHAPARHQSEIYPNAPRIGSGRMFGRSVSTLPNPITTARNVGGDDGAMVDGVAGDGGGSSQNGFLLATSAAQNSSPAGGAFLTPPASTSVTSSPSASPTNFMPSPLPNDGTLSQRSRLLSQPQAAVAAPAPAATLPTSGSRSPLPPRPQTQQPTVTFPTSGFSAFASVSVQPADMANGPSNESPTHEQPLSPSLAIPQHSRSTTGSLMHSRSHSRHSSIAPSPMQRTSTTTTLHPGTLLPITANNPQPSSVETSAASRMSAVSGDKRAKAITVLMRRLLVTLRGTHLSSGICIMIDNANNLDSASEQLLLDLATQLPWLLFIFAGRRTDEPCSLKQQLVPFKNAAEREKEKLDRKLERAREKASKAHITHPSPGKHSSRTMHVSGSRHSSHKQKHHTMPRSGRSQPQLNNDENAVPEVAADEPNAHSTTSTRPSSTDKQKRAKEKLKETEKEKEAERQKAAHRHQRYDVSQHTRTLRKKTGDGQLASPMKQPNEPAEDDMQEVDDAGQQLGAVPRKLSQGNRVSLSVPSTSLNASGSPSPVAGSSPGSSPGLSPNSGASSSTSSIPALRSSVMSSSGPTLSSVPVSPNKSPKRGPARSVSLASPQQEQQLHPPSRSHGRTNLLMSINTAQNATVPPGSSDHSPSGPSSGHSPSPSPPPQSQQSMASTGRRGPPLQHYATISSRSPLLPAIEDVYLDHANPSEVLSRGIDGLHIVEGNEEDEARKEQEDTTNINRPPLASVPAPASLDRRSSVTHQQLLSRTVSSTQPSSGSPRSYYGNDLDTLMVGGLADGTDSIGQPTQTTKNRSPRELSDGRNGTMSSSLLPIPVNARSVSVSMGQLSRRASNVIGQFGVTASQHFAFNAAAGASGTATPAGQAISAKVRHRTLSSAKANATSAGDGGDAEERRERHKLAAIFIELGGLKEEDMDELLQSVLKCQVVDAKLLQLVLERSNGIPLYAEEMAQQLLNSGIIQVVPEQQSRHGGAFPSHPAPVAAVPTLPAVTSLGIGVSRETTAGQIAAGGGAIILPSTSPGVTRESTAVNAAAVAAGAVVALPSSSSPLHRVSFPPRLQSGIHAGESSHDHNPHLARSSSHFSLPHSPSVSPVSHHVPIQLGASSRASPTLHPSTPTNELVHGEGENGGGFQLPTAPLLQAHDQSAASQQAPAAVPLAAVVPPNAAAIILPTAAALSSTTSAKETAIMASMQPQASTEAPGSPLSVLSGSSGNSASSSRSHRPSSRVTQLQGQSMHERESSGLVRLRSARATSPVRPVRMIATFTSSLDASQHHIDLSSIPESMDEMIAAQIDALPPDLQLLLKMCAVFGRVVDCRCIRKVWGIYGARKQRKRRKSLAAVLASDKARRASVQMSDLQQLHNIKQQASTIDRIDSHSVSGPPTVTPSSPALGGTSLGLAGSSATSSGASDFESDVAALVERGWLRPLGEDGAGAGESVITAELEGEDNASAAMLQFRYSAAVNVAYNRLPFSFRGILHKCIGEWFEELYHCNPLHQLLPRLALHWWKTAEYLSDSASTATIASPASSASSASPHTPLTPKAGEQMNVPLPIIPTIDDPMTAAGKTALIPPSTSVARQESDPIITTTVYHVQPTPILTSPTEQPPLPHAATVLVAGPHATSHAHSTNSLHGHRQSLTAAPSASTVLHCRHRAIHWLRKAGEHAAKQGARREAIKFLGHAIQLIEQLPQKNTLVWRRRLLLVMTLYLPTYSVLVGVSKTLNEWSTLCSLCEELQMRAELAKRKRQQEAQIADTSDEASSGSAPSGSPDDNSEMDSSTDDSGLSSDEEGNEDTSATNVARATFYALRGYYLGLCTVNNGSVDLDEALRVSGRMLKIAENSDDWQMLTHALLLLAMQHNNTALYEEGMVFCDQAWQLFLDNDSYPPYQVNTYAPMDASICSLLCRAQARCVLGQLKDSLDDTEIALFYAHRNAEPLTLMYAMNMHCFVLLQMDKRDPRVERYWDHAEAISTDTAGPTTLFEIEMALFSAYEFPDDLQSIQQAAERCWERYHNGPKWFIGFSGPMCHLLLLAGYWELGLHFIADWHLISIEGRLGHWYPECLRYEAMFLLQQAEAIIEEDNGTAAAGWRESSHNEGSDDEAERDSSFSYYNPADRPTPLQRPQSDPLPSQSSASSDTSSSESRSDIFSGREGSESSRSTSPPPSVDVWTLREEARQRLNAAIQLAEHQRARLLEMKAIMTLIPLLRFLQQVAPTALHNPSNDSPALSQSSLSASFNSSLDTSAVNSGHSSPARRTSFSVTSQPIREGDERLHIRLESQVDEPSSEPLSTPPFSLSTVLTSPGKLTTDNQLPSPPAVHSLSATPPNGVDELAGVVSPAHEMHSPYETECIQHEERLRVLLHHMEMANEGMQFALFDEAREMLGLAAPSIQPDEMVPRRQQSWTEGQHPRAASDMDAEARGEASKRMIAQGQQVIAHGQAAWFERMRE